MTERVGHVQLWSVITRDSCFLCKAFMGFLSGESAVESIVVVVVFSLLESFGKQVGVVDDIALEEPIGLFRVDPV